MTNLDAGATMSDDRQSGDTGPAGGKKSHRHHTDHSGWLPADQVKSGPQPTRSGKTMHHPASRIGEIKRGK